MVLTLMDKNKIGLFDSYLGNTASPRQCVNVVVKDDCFTVRCDLIVLGETGVADAAAPAVVFAPPPPDWPQHFRALLQGGQGADVRFLIESKTFAEHRCVLATRSLVFSAELYGMMREGAADHNSSGAVRIDDMRADVFGHLLHFIYTDLLRQETLEALQPQKEEEATSMAQHLLGTGWRGSRSSAKTSCAKTWSSVRWGRRWCWTSSITAKGSRMRALSSSRLRGSWMGRVATEGFQHLAKRAALCLVRAAYL
ncbi:hypothetical protein EJB05_50677, partial [Eragrostis curvula]